MSSKRGLWLSFCISVVAGLLICAPMALAHIERAAYWPNPNPETVGGVPTGGSVPQVRSLYSALDPKPAGDTRVVCQGQPPSAPKGLKKKGKSDKQRQLRKKYDKQLRNHPSMKRLRASINKALGKSGKKKKGKKGKKGAAESKKKGKKKKKKNNAPGYEIRPSEPNIKVGKKETDKLFNFNIKLLKRCAFDQIQPAVNASGNNDRVVVMPGIYTEPTSRAQPTNDPKCDGLEEENDRGQTGALSYAYQATCPNDQNLVAVIGRQPNHAIVDGQAPLLERRGIPDDGPCLRCNLQLEGSGLSPDDVIVDGGRVESGNKGPIESKKDVTIRADRADGFVLYNLTARHAAEHALYIPEADGFRVERYKGYATEEYAILTFTADHGLITDCDTADNGDAAIYPGSSADVGEQTQEGSRRYAQEIRRCDMRHSTLGYSGTAANSVWFHNNDVYDNALGFSTDVFTAAGHPGFPQDSDLLENNEFYSNNFNPYLPHCAAGQTPGPNGPNQNCSDVDPTVGVAVGVGGWIAGGNNNIVRNNHFWNNWRRGFMLFAIPDTFVCGPATGNSQAGCVDGEFNTSYRNQFHSNTMGRTPQGLVDPNGVDFWWDQGGLTNPPRNTDNCWFNNTGANGTPGGITSQPANLPADCASSLGGVGQPNALEVNELLTCATAPEMPGGPCPWYNTPPEP